MTSSSQTDENSEDVPKALPRGEQDGNPRSIPPSSVSKLENSAKQLSLTSTRYDIGGKGFLTPAEQHMRELDKEGQGQLTNEQVVSIVEQTMALRDTNSKLRLWVLALFTAVIVLGLSNIGTAFAAARLAKDTSVNDSTGVMVVKGSNTIVVTQSTGFSVHAREYTDEGGTKRLCMGREDSAVLMNRTMEGYATTVIVTGEDGFSVHTISISPSNSGYNSTGNCFGQGDNPGNPLCTSYGSSSSCSLSGNSNSRRMLATTIFPAEHQAHYFSSLVRGVNMTSDIDKERRLGQSEHRHLLFNLGGFLYYDEEGKELVTDKTTCENEAKTSGIKWTFSTSFGGYCYDGTSGGGVDDNGQSYTQTIP